VNWRPLYQLKVAAREGLLGLGQLCRLDDRTRVYLPTILLWLFTILAAAATGGRLCAGPRACYLASLRKPQANSMSEVPARWLVLVYSALPLCAGCLVRGSAFRRKFPNYSRSLIGPQAALLETSYSASPPRPKGRVRNRSPHHYEGTMHKLLMALFSLTLFAVRRNRRGKLRRFARATPPPRSPFTTRIFCCPRIPAARPEHRRQSRELRRITSHLEPDSVILRDLTGRPLQISNRVTATTPSPRSCCYRSTKARRSNSCTSTARRLRTVNGKIVRSGYVPIS